MLNYANGPQYSNYTYNQDVINQQIEAEVLRRTATLQENYESLKQRYGELYDTYNDYYLWYIFSSDDMVSADWLSPF